MQTVCILPSPYIMHACIYAIISSCCNYRYAWALFCKKKTYVTQDTLFCNRWLKEASCPHYYFYGMIDTKCFYWKYKFSWIFNDLFNDCKDIYLYLYINESKFIKSVSKERVWWNGRELRNGAQINKNKKSKFHVWKQ